MKAMLSQPDLKYLLDGFRKFNGRGVMDVQVQDGTMVVLTRTAKAALGVQIDLLRTRAFESVTAERRDGNVVAIIGTPKAA